MHRQSVARTLLVGSAGSFLLVVVLRAMPAAPAPPASSADPAPVDAALCALQRLRGVPQPDRDAPWRRRVDRRVVAFDDDGQLGARSVLAGRRAARDDRPSQALRGDPGRVRHLPHADDAADCRRRPVIRARCSRSCHSRIETLPAIGAWRATASRARCAIRSPRTSSARRRASTPDSCSRVPTRRACGRCRGLTPSTPGASASCNRSRATSRSRHRTSSSRSCAPRVTR